MNRVTALLHVINDASRSQSERDDALAALKSLVTDGSDEAERRQARAQLAILDSDCPPTSPALDHLAEQLLRCAHVSTLGEVPHHAVHQFLTELGITTPDAHSLYQRWLHESPEAQRKMQQMAVHLANCFFDQQEVLAARLQDATAKGQDTQAIRNEIKRLFKSWVDSSIFNEHPEIRQMMRDVLANKL